MRRTTAAIVALVLPVALLGCSAVPREVSEAPPAPVVTSASVEPTAPVAPRSATIPSVKGKSLEMAQWKLEQLGLRSRVKWKASSVRRGKVLSQSPSRGVARPGSVVVLTVSKGQGGGSGSEEAPAATGGGLSAGDQAAKRAFDTRQSDIALSGEGTVSRVLSDDLNGSRHQRFILRLDSGQTLLIAHNIDIAPRLPSLAAGDKVAFKGVYEWNDEGGTVHWTHDDPDGTHPAGWLKFNGTTYR